MKPKDRIALIVAVGLVTWGVVAIGGMVWRNKALSEVGGEFFVGVGGAMVAMLVTYMATKHNGNGK